MGAINAEFHYLTSAGALLRLSSQTAACNRLRLIEERRARWLLMVHDRTQTDRDNHLRAYQMHPREHDLLYIAYFGEVDNHRALLGTYLLRILAWSY